jgi:hypothetical protein
MLGDLILGALTGQIFGPLNIVFDLSKNLAYCFFFPIYTVFIAIVYRIGKVQLAKDIVVLVRVIIAALEKINPVFNFSASGFSVIFYESPFEISPGDMSFDPFGSKP